MMSPIQLGRAFYGISTYRRRKTVLIFETSEKAWAATRKDLLQHNINQMHHEKVRGNDNKVLKIPLNENSLQLGIPAAVQFAQRSSKLGYENQDLLLLAH